jgi:hypothetical protein
MVLDYIEHLYKPAWEGRGVVEEVTE